MSKLITFLALLLVAIHVAPLNAQIKIDKLKKQQEEILKKKESVKTPVPEKNSGRTDKPVQSPATDQAGALSTGTEEHYNGPARQAYQTLQNRLKMAADYVEKYQQASGDHQRKDAGESAERYLQKVEADLKEVAGLDPALDLSREKQAYDSYLAQLAQSMDAAEKEAAGKADEGKSLYTANQLVQQLIGLMEYDRFPMTDKESLARLQQFTFQDLEALAANTSLQNGMAQSYRNNLDKLRSLLETANLSSWFTGIRNDFNNYRQAKQYAEAEQIAVFLGHMTRFLADASPNFSRLKQDADYLLSDYRKEQQDKALSVASGNFQLEHLNQILLSSEAVTVGKERPGQFKTAFRDTEPIRAVLYLDKKVIDLTGDYGYVPINLFIDDPQMKNGCVLQYDYSWFTTLAESGQSYLVIDIVPDLNDFQPRHKALGPESFARCFAGLTPGKHEVILKLGLTRGSGWGATFTTSFSIEISEQGRTAFGELQTEQEAARQWTEKHDKKAPMSDPAVEKGLMKGLETLVQGAGAVKAVIKDRDWTYVRDRKTADTLGKQIAAEVWYRASDGSCYVQRVYGFYKALSHNQFVEQVEIKTVNPPYPVKCP